MQLEARRTSFAYPLNLTPPPPSPVQLEGGMSHAERQQQQQPIPLNLMVSGMLQVDRRDQHKATNEQQQRAEQQQQQQQAHLHLEQKTPSTTSLQYYQQQGPTATAAALTAASLSAVDAAFPAAAATASGSPVHGTPTRRIGGNAGFLFTGPGGSPGPAAAVAAMLLERDISPSSSPIRPQPASPSSVRQQHRQQYLAAGVLPRPSPAKAAAAYAHNAAAYAHSAASSKWGSWGGGSVASSSAAALGPWQPSGLEQPDYPGSSGGGEGGAGSSAPAVSLKPQEVMASPAKPNGSGGVSYSGGRDDGMGSRDQHFEINRLAAAAYAPAASASAAAAAGTQGATAMATWHPVSSPVQGGPSSPVSAVPAAASSRLVPDSWAPPQYMAHQQRGQGGGDEEEAQLRASLMTPSKRVSADLHMTSAPRV